jgi:hypothetical protein
MLAPAPQKEHSLPYRPSRNHQGHDRIKRTKQLIPFPSLLILPTRVRNGKGKSWGYVKNEQFRQCLLLLSAVTQAVLQVRNKYHERGKNGGQWVNQL